MGETDSGQCRLDRTSMDFGTVGLDSSAVDSFVVRNIGGGTLNGRIRQLCSGFTVVAGEGIYALSPGQRRIVRIRFAPSQAGPAECSVQVGGSCGSVLISGQGESPPLCEVSPTHLDFDTVTVNGDPKEMGFTIRNAGRGTLRGSVRSTCSEFTVVSGDSSYALRAGEEQRFNIRFAPASAGFRSCTIQTGDACLDAVTLQGIGELPPLCDLSETTLDFGDVLVGASASRSVVLTNVGGGTLSGSFTLSCPGFALLTGDPAYRLGAGESKTFLFRFRPEAEGEYACTVETGGDCSSLSLTGRGTLPPTGSCCFADGSCQVLTQENCAGIGWGATPTCDPNPCPQPSGACCSSDGSCEFIQQAVCTTGDWRSQVACDPNPCPPPLGACCAHDGSCLFVAEAECATGDWRIHIECAPISPCPQPNGACCYPDGSCRFGDQSTCSTGDWRIDVPCEPENPCIGPAGACCHPDGTCEYVVRGSCATTDWRTGVPCDPQPCPQPQGACCSPDGSCAPQTQADCPAPSQWRGFGSSCDPNPCPPPIPTGACCNLTTGSCSVQTEVICSQQTYPYSWQGPSTTCTPNLCPPPPPRGACCMRDGTCISTLQADCSAGDWRANLSCSPNPCPWCQVLPDSALDFGPVVVGESRQLELIVANVGESSFSGLAALDCPQFAFVSGGGAFTVPPQESHVIELSFTPVEAGPTSCTVNLNTPLCPGVTLTAEGVAPPQCTPSVTELDFGAVVANGAAFADRAFQITNTGAGILSGTVTENCSDFTIQSSAGYYLGPGDSQEFTVRFRPSRVDQPGGFGPRTCTIEAGPSCEISASGQASPGFSDHILTNMGACASCHPGSGVPDVRNYDVAVTEVDPNTPSQSPLLLFPSGHPPAGHSHGEYAGWRVGETAYELVLLWIQYGVLR